MTTETFAVADIGGTNARFAKAYVDQDQAIVLGDPVTLATGDYATFAQAWDAFLASDPGVRPRGASLALAGPVSQSRFKLANADWTFDNETLADEVGLDRLVLLNDFEAIAHAIAGDLSAGHLEHIAGPSSGLPEDGTITVIGPGTGLGIAYLRIVDGCALIQATEGSHIDFAPVCDLDDRVLALLRARHDRVSVERVISGDGIAWIHAALTGQPTPGDPLPIWRAGLSGQDALAARAVAHFVTTLGRIAGDYALAHGSGGVVLAGGLGLRLHEHFAEPAFHDSFIAKGRYCAMMEAIPIKLITHPQPGLLGAAHAFCAQR